MKRLVQLSTASFLLLGFSAAVAFAENTNTTRPNILIICADDMGIGDVKCFGDALGSTSIVPTPRMDSLASQGMMFTQMHSGSALCTPSRYGLLTGRYSWRLKAEGVLGGGVAGSYSQPIIRQGELTLAQFLKNQGYDTAGFGKWHLGAQFYDQQGKPFDGKKTSVTDPSQIDLARRVEGHAVDQGFNSFFGAIGSLSGNPFAYVVNDRIHFNGAPATTNTPWVMIPGSSFAQGSQASDTVGDPNLTQRRFTPDMIDHARKYLIGRRSKPEPFFAYVSLYSPHLPLIPAKEFVGASGKTNFPYGDYVYETDHQVGQVLDALGVSASNTLVIVTSDNGPEGVNFAQGKNRGHDANGPFKGVKQDSWEGGHRIPLIVRWPDKVAPGTISSNLLWQGDIFATVASHLGAKIPTGQSPDSVSFLPTLLGTGASSRKDLVIASGGVQLSLQTADGWKLIDGSGSGGARNSHDADNRPIPTAHGKVGGTPKQLFYLPDDIGERTNLEATNSAKATELLKRLEAYQK